MKKDFVTVKSKAHPLVLCSKNIENESILVYENIK